MYDLADFAQQMAPPQRQKMTAQLLRQRSLSDALQEASQRADQYGDLSAVSQMANNPELAAAAQSLHRGAQKRYAPVQMGQQGFVIPSSGEFVSSPMYEDEKDAARAATRDNSRARLQASIEAQRERESAREERSARDSALRQSIAAQADSTRQQTSAAGNDTRLLLASMAANRVADRYASTRYAGSAKFEKEPLTAKQQQAVLDNRANIGAIDVALEHVKNNKEAFGLKNALPDELLQRIPGKDYSGGVAARASVQNIGSLKIHDRSGAAVTAAEFPRLKQFVPLTRDTPETVEIKLGQFRDEYARILEEIDKGYPVSHFLKNLKKDTGSVVPTARGVSSAQSGIQLPRVTPARQAPAGIQLPPGFTYIGPAN